MLFVHLFLLHSSEVGLWVVLPPLRSSDGKQARLRKWGNSTGGGYRALRGGRIDTYLGTSNYE